jgi:carboxymethylenebutenolidase
MNLKQRAAFQLEQLSRMQRYVGEEMVEKYELGLISWGQMLRSLILVGGSAAAAAALLALAGEDLPQPPARNSQMPQITIQPPNGLLTVAADDPAVSGKIVNFSNGPTTITGYLAQPAKPGSYPGVIVIHEANGLSEHIKDVARRVAKAGYMALVPDLLSRWGITPELPFEKIMGYLGNAKPEEILADLNASVTYLASQPEVKDGNKLGVVGFCFGGGYSLNLAAVNPKIKAAICYYGVTPQPASQMANTEAAILAHYGEADPRVNATVPELEEVLQQHNKTFERYFYEKAGHAFNNDTVSPAFKEEAAVQAWQRTIGWFATYL